MTYRPYQQIISEAVSQSGGGGDSNIQLLNGSGSVLDAFLPVTVNVNGDIKNIDVSDETDALNTVGVLTSITLNNTQGTVVRLGKIENVNTLGFDFRDIIYVAKDGTLTNLTPEVGAGGFVSGDFIIKIGKITKNQTNTLQKDLLVAVEVIGQLA